MSKLQKNEWPALAIPKMEPEVFELCYAVRDVSGAPMVPSPDPEAHVRYTDGNSLHCIGLDGSKKSEATDLFILNAIDVPNVWVQAQRVKALGGFGIYFDTKLAGKTTTMIHVDLRNRRTLWLCPSEKKRRYVYYNADPVLFMNLLAKEFSKL